MKWQNQAKEAKEAKMAKMSRNASIPRNFQGSSSIATIASSRTNGTDQ